MPLVVVVWASVVIVGLLVAVIASKRGVDLAVRTAAAFGAPPLAIGITLIAIGTDLPEIANSIVSSVTGHGDVNVGDSIGSAATQSTLVLGLLPWIAVPVLVGARRVLTVSTVTVVALVVGAALMSDGELSRLDGSALLAVWAGGSVLVWRGSPVVEQPQLPMNAARPVRDGLLAMAWFALVGLGATAAVGGMVQLSAELGIPEYLISFTALALGTSLPELMVDVTALRRGQGDLAIGDALGSSMVDATLSLGIGPLVAPVAVTASLAVRSSLWTAVGLALVALLLGVTRKLGRTSGVALVAIYVGMYVLVLSGQV